MADERMTNTPVDAAENKLIMTKLNAYISGIDIGLPWNFEFFSETVPALSVRYPSGAIKTKLNIVGSYEAEQIFTIYHRVLLQTTNNISSLTAPLYQLADLFNAETKSGFLNLDLENLRPLKLEMIEIPLRDSEVINGNCTFYAKYKLTYKN